MYDMQLYYLLLMKHMQTAAYQVLGGTIADERGVLALKLRKAGLFPESGHLQQLAHSACYWVVQSAAAYKYAPDPP